MIKLAFLKLALDSKGFLSESTRRKRFDYVVAEENR